MSCFTHRVVRKGMISMPNSLDTPLSGNNVCATRSGRHYYEIDTTGPWCASRRIVTNGTSLRTVQGCTKNNSYTYVPPPPASPEGRKRRAYFLLFLPSVFPMFHFRAYNQCTLPLKHVLNTYVLEIAAHSCGLAWVLLFLRGRRRSSVKTIPCSGNLGQKLQKKNTNYI